MFHMSSHETTKSPFVSTKKKKHQKVVEALITLWTAVNQAVNGNLGYGANPELKQLPVLMVICAN